LTSNATLTANAIEINYDNSVSPYATFVIVSMPSPRITHIGLNGTTLTISGTNGLANETYVLLTSTNLAFPLNQWMPVLTNALDSGGNLNLSTNIVNPSEVRTFYILRMQ
jgi:hypothetical protein